MRHYLGPYILPGTNWILSRKSYFQFCDLAREKKLTVPVLISQRWCKSSLICHWTLYIVKCTYSIGTDQLLIFNTLTHCLIEGFLIPFYCTLFVAGAGFRGRISIRSWGQSSSPQQFKLSGHQQSFRSHLIIFFFFFLFWISNCVLWLIWCMVQILETLILQFGCFSYSNWNFDPKHL